MPDPKCEHARTFPDRGFRGTYCFLKMDGAEINATNLRQERCNAKSCKTCPAYKANKEFKPRYQPIEGHEIRVPQDRWGNPHAPFGRR